MLPREADQEKMDTVVDMVEEEAAGLEAREVDTVVVAADPWALLRHLETGGVARGLMHMVEAAEAASEVEEVATSGSLHDLCISLATRRICTEGDRQTCLLYSGS
jgi:hypothetical protein